MSLLALLTAKAAPPVTPTDDPNPDLIAQTRPGVYNSSGFMVFTDPYGHNGSVVHPDVLDFGREGWGGHQYWIAATPYYNGNDSQENPCIYYADHPTQWVEATQNPIYPYPGRKWNSDTELVHDPDTDELVVVFRDADFNFVLARSKDGKTWPTTTTKMDVPDLGSERLCPVVLRDPAAGKWMLWAITVTGRTMYRMTADQLEGPWGEVLTCTGLPTDIWHMNHVRDGGRLICLMQRTMNPGPIHLASSYDGGVSWAINEAATIAPGASGAWDDYRTYRAALTLHPSGTHARIWYPGWGTGSDTYRIGYTEVPLNEWP